MLLRQIHIDQPLIALVNTGTHIYVIGGWKNVVGGAMESMTSVNRWFLINNNWETCPSLLEAVVNPISVSNNQYIFVIGSYKEEDLSCKSAGVQHRDIRVDIYCRITSLCRQLVCFCPYLQEQTHRSEWYPSDEF